MTIKTLCLGCTLVLATAFGTHAVTSQDAEGGMDPELMMKMMQVATPGDAHAALAASAGTWTTSMKMSMVPGAPPQTFPGEATRRMIIGGRYVIEEYKSTFMGQPYEGMLLQGFDKLSEEHWSIWVDSMNTGHMLSIGKENEAGDIVQEGITKDVMTPEGRPYRTVLKHVSDDEVLFSMYEPNPDGSEREIFEITYTRQGGTR